MTTFVAVNEDVVAKRINAATDRVIYVAPAISVAVAKALAAACIRSQRVSFTVVLDPDEAGYRLGFGDVEGLKLLHTVANDYQLAIREQAGLRIGLLVVDSTVLIWSPTARAVEDQREGQESNGVDLGSRVLIEDERQADVADGGGEPAVTGMAAYLNEVLAADDAVTPVNKAEIGKVPMRPEHIQATVESLTANPPAPFDLARSTRVFSTKFQYVELEMRGAEWTRREIKLDSVLLNADAPDEIQEAFETRVKPYSHMGDVEIEVPVIAMGQIAYTQKGEKILAPMKQSQLEKSWKELRQRYVVHLPGFGWLLRRTDKQKFEAEIKAFETVVTDWVKGFRAKVAEEDDALIDRIVSTVSERVARSRMKKPPGDDEIRNIVTDGIERLRITDPKIKVIFKDVSWESTRDEEFKSALGKALPAAELKGWVETFLAARQKKA